MNFVEEYLGKCAIGEGHLDVAFQEVEKILGSELAFHLWLKYSEQLFIRFLRQREEQVTNK